VVKVILQKKEKKASKKEKESMFSKTKRQKISNTEKQISIKKEGTMTQPQTSLLFDDTMKNGVKTYIWGNAYWTMWHLLAESLNDFSPEFAPFVKLLMLSPRDTIPCVHCRTGCRKFLAMPDYNIDIFIKHRTLPQFVYLLHNAVNLKLSKPIQGGLAPPLSPPLGGLAPLKPPSFKDDGDYNCSHNGGIMDTSTSVYQNDDLVYIGDNIVSNNIIISNYRGGLGGASTPSPYKDAFLERKSSKWCQINNEDSKRLYNNEGGLKGGEAPHDKGGLKGGVPLNRHDSIFNGSNNITPYERVFWQWIETIAFNFPADIQLINYWNGTSKDKFAFPDGTEQAKELQSRLNTYILFFDLLKNFIDRQNPLFRKWIQAYFTHTPSMMTFSCRTRLLQWVLEMQKACGYQDDRFYKKANKNTCRKNKMVFINDENDYSFISMLEELHPTRAVD
jgi:hypothetical protein